MLATMMKNAANSTIARIFGRSSLVTASAGSLAQAGQAEDELGQHGAAEQAAEVETEDR